MTSEGTSPRAAVIFDRDGSLYGTLASDGTFGAGAVFRLEPTNGTWKEKTLYTFTGGTDGSGPLCRLVLFRGKLYGTTVVGGGASVGTVFELSPAADHHGAWTLNVLHTFACGSDGCYPWAGLTVDSKARFMHNTVWWASIEWRHSFRAETGGRNLVRGRGFHLHAQQRSARHQRCAPRQRKQALRHDHRQRHECRRGFRNPAVTIAGADFMRNK